MVVTISCCYCQQTFQISEPDIGSEVICRCLHCREHVLVHGYEEGREGDKRRRYACEPFVPEEGRER